MYYWVMISENDEILVPWNILFYHNNIHSHLITIFIGLF